jgi:pimeloyl-ACP methyl ester carboxylesterase
MGGVIAADVSTPWILDFIPRLLDKSLPNFGPTAKEFAESCVAHGDQLDQGTRFEWVGAVATQHPDVRSWSIPQTQNEAALMQAAQTLPYLVLHGGLDKHVNGTKLREWMTPLFRNLRFQLYTDTDTGHASFWDNPDRTNCEVVAFAQRLNSVSLSFPNGLLADHP